jgi:hypothetical protein
MQEQNNQNPSNDASDIFSDMQKRQMGGGDQLGEQKKFVIKQYDLTGYMLHILMKVTEILYLSVCQIPTPIRSFIKIFSEHIIRNKPGITKPELYLLLNSLLIDQWLSQSF